MTAANIKSDSAIGRILLSMRPGRIGYAELTERFGPISSRLDQLMHSHLVERVDGLYQLTDAGRAACPNRRDTNRPATKSNMARKHGWSSVHKAQVKAEQAGAK